MNSDLKAYRIVNKLSQSQLATLLGISKSAISMVENERRELPPEAMKKFVALTAEKSGAGGIITSPSGLLQSVLESHARESEEYLQSYKKDCEFALHKLEKQVSNWTKRYMQAASRLLISVNLEKFPGKEKLGQKFLIEKELERIAAMGTLMEIARQKPEIVMLRIDGLKQELRSIKAMLGKKKKFLGMKDIGLAKLAEQNFLANKADTNLLPPADES